MFIIWPSVYCAIFQVLSGSNCFICDASEAVSEEYRRWLRSLFVDLSEAAGASDAIALGRQLSLLYDGAAVAARMDQDRRGAATAVRAAVAALLDAAVPPKRDNRAKAKKELLG